MAVFVGPASDFESVRHFEGSTLVDALEGSEQTFITAIKKYRLQTNQRNGLGLKVLLHPSGCFFDSVFKFHNWLPTKNTFGPRNVWVSLFGIIFWQRK